MNDKQTNPIKVMITITLIIISLFIFSACQNKSGETSALSTGDVDASKSEPSSGAAEPILESDQEEKTDDASETPSYYFDDLTLHALSGEEKSLFDYEGDLIILNFWATWCTYCEQEMPLLDALHQQEGISVIAIDVGEDADTVQKYVDRYGYHLDFYLDEDSELASTFGVSAFPTSIFIGPDFEYYYTYPGMLTEEYLTQLLDAIETYQASKSVAN